MKDTTAPVLAESSACGVASPSATFSVPLPPTLGKKWNFTNTLPRLRREERRSRYELRSGLRPILGGLVREGSAGSFRRSAGLGSRNSFGFCGSAVGYEGVSPSIEVRSVGLERRASVRGVASCSNAWVCPVCSPRVRSFRASEVETATSRHLAGGGRLAFLTLTVRHSAGDELAELRRGISGAWSRVQSARKWRNWRDAGQLVGVVRSWDVTYSRVNGFHPHLHLLLFLADGVETADIGRFLAVEWLESVRVVLGEKRVPSARHGVDFAPVRDAPAVASYLTKVAGSGGLSLELLNPAGLKVARPRLGAVGLSSWQLLALAVAGESWAVPLAREFYLGMRGVYVVSWSRGLKQRFGVEEVPDSETVELDEMPAVAVSVVPLPVDVLAFYNSSPAGVTPLLDIAERRGVSALIAEIDATALKIRSRPPAPPPPRLLVSPVPVPAG